MTSKIRFLGIDQSFTSTGYVVLDENNQMIDFGRIITNEEQQGDVFDRAHFIASYIGVLYLAHTPQLIGLEGLAFSKFGDATRDLAGLQFTIVNYLRNNMKIKKDDMLIPTPNTVKKFATGKGNSNKDALVDSLPKDVLQLFKDRKYKKTTGLTDVTDAYWIARITVDAYHRKNENYKQTNQ